jgi:hypothetical protein
MGSVRTSCSKPARRWRSGLVVGNYLGLFLLLLLSATAEGQQPARSPLRLPFDSEPQLLFKALMGQASNREDFERLLRAFQDRPDSVHLDKAFQKKLLDQWNDPQMRRHIEAVLGKDAGQMKKLDPEKVKALQKTLEQFKQPERKEGGPTPIPLQPPAPAPGAEAPPPAEKGTDEDEAELTDWLHDRLLDLQETRVGQVLRESPAFQQGLVEMQEALLQQRGGPGLRLWDVHKLAEHLPLSYLDLSRVKAGWEKLPAIPLPALPRPSLPFGRFVPVTPGVPAASRGGALQALLWLLLFAAVGFLLWRVAGRLRRSNQAARSWHIGPWPVDPARIATRAELVQAFEHLALLLLGPTARTWNHLAVAAELAGADPDAAQRHNATAELADLYEQARYAPQEEPLSPEGLAAARHDLCLLAGVTHP